MANKARFTRASASGGSPGRAQIPASGISGVSPTNPNCATWALSFRWISGALSNEAAASTRPCSTDCSAASCVPAKSASLKKVLGSRSRTRPRLISSTIG